MIHNILIHKFLQFFFFFNFIQSMYLYVGSVLCPLTWLWTKPCFLFIGCSLLLVLVGEFEFKSQLIIFISVIYLRFYSLKYLFNLLCTFSFISLQENSSDNKTGAELETHGDRSNFKWYYNEGIEGFQRMPWTVYNYNRLDTGSE